MGDGVLLGSPNLNENMYGVEGLVVGKFVHMFSPTIPEDAETLKQTGFTDQLFSTSWYNVDFLAPGLAQV